MPREFIQKLTSLVEANLANEKFGPEELAREAGMSHSSLNRKLNTITNQSASQFIREIRLKKAKELLQNEDATIAEISYRVGFGSPTYFNKCYREYFGVAPGELRNKEDNETEINLPDKPNNRKPAFIFYSILLIAIVATVFFILFKKSSTKQIEPEKSIAVLPFVDMSLEPGSEYIIKGLMEVILNKLENISELKIKSRTDVEKYKDSKISTAEIGRELNVTYLLEGRWQKIANMMTVRLNLIETSSGNQIWSKNFTFNEGDIFYTQNDIALAVASELNIRLTPKEKQQIEKGLYVVEPIKMKVLIYGVDNLVNIPEFTHDSLWKIITIDNGTITGKRGTYIIRPEHQGYAIVNASMDGGSARLKFTFPVMDLNILWETGTFVRAEIAGKPGGDISKKELLEQDMIYAVVEKDFHTNLTFKITEFVLQTPMPGGYITVVPSKSDKITENQKKNISNSQVGSLVYFGGIKCKGPDGIIRDLRSISFRLTE